MKMRVLRYRILNMKILMKGCLQLCVRMNVMDGIPEQCEVIFDSLVF